MCACVRVKERQTESVWGWEWWVNIDTRVCVNQSVFIDVYICIVHTDTLFIWQTQDQWNRLNFSVFCRNKYRAPQYGCSNKGNISNSNRFHGRLPPLSWVSSYSHSLAYVCAYGLILTRNWTCSLLISSNN